MEARASGVSERMSYDRALASAAEEACGLRPQKIRSALPWGMEPIFR